MTGNLFEAIERRWSSAARMEALVMTCQTSKIGRKQEQAIAALMTHRNVDEAALAEVMHVVPLGAGVLAGTAVALLVLGYLAIYLFVFLSRGPAG